MKYELVIFDMDGTILDTLNDLYQSVNVALLENHFPERTLDEVRQFVGNGIRKLMERAVPENTKKEDIDKVHAAFTAYYKEHCADTTKPYAGITQLIDRLKAAGVKTAVVSNKADYAVQILAKQYFPDAFDAAVGEKPGIQKKPSPDSVNAVLKQLDVKRQNAIYIGDSEVDIETAENAEMDSISVLWGFRSRAFLTEHNARQLVEKPEEIEHCILGK